MTEAMQQILDDFTVEDGSGIGKSGESDSSKSSSTVSLRSDKEEDREVVRENDVAAAGTNHAEVLNPGLEAQTPIPTNQDFEFGNTLPESSTILNQTDSNSPPDRPESVLETSTEKNKLQKKVQISAIAMKKPRTARLSTNSRITPDVDPEIGEPISSELHVVRTRKACSAPTRSRDLFARSSNLGFLQKECEKLERKMRKSASANLTTRPKITPYKPFTWNSLAPYSNTDTLRYIITMPVPVRRGYNTRATASGLVDPADSWRMDHCVTPTTPSRPELFRQHYAKRRTKSAMPKVTYDKSILTPRYPKINATTYDILAGNGSDQSPRRRRPKEA